MKIKTLLAALAIFISLLSANFVYAQESAADKVPDACAKATTAADLIRCGSNKVGGGEEPRTIDETIANIINIFSVVIGVIAVIMILVAGFRYITSGGDATRLKGAKDTLLYAVIGLIVVALAQVIVRFVLNTTTANGSQGECQRTRNGAFWVGGPNAGKPC